MSLNSNKTVIKRFTYDWLIRFAELHPVEIRDYLSEDFYSKDPYDPYRSKYAAISPLFTTLILKNMPYLVYDRFDMQNCEKISNSLPMPKRNSILVSEKSFLEDAETISWLKDNRTTFYGKKLDITLAAITPEELQYLFKICNFDKTVKVKTTLTEPLMFSDLWPLIKYCSSLTINIKNLIYDEDIVSVFRKKRVFQEFLYLEKLNLSDESLLKLVDYFLSMPLHPFQIILAFRSKKSAALGSIIMDKYSARLREEFFIKPSHPFNFINIFQSSSGIFFEDLNYSES